MHSNNTQKKSNEYLFVACVWRVGMCDLAANVQRNGVLIQREGWIIVASSVDKSIQGE